MKLLILLSFCVASALSAVELVEGEDANLAKAAWQPVKLNEVDMLVNFFELYPQHQSRFPAFAGKDLNEIKDTAVFATQAGRIISKISEFNQLMGDEANFEARKNILIELGVLHKKMNISKEAFNDFRDAMIVYLSKNVSWGDNVEAVFRETIRTAYNVIFKVLDGETVE